MNLIFRARCQHGRPGRRLGEANGFLVKCKHQESNSGSNRLMFSIIAFLDFKLAKWCGFFFLWLLHQTQL